MTDPKHWSVSRVLGPSPETEIAETANTSQTAILKVQVSWKTRGKPGRRMAKEALSTWEQARWSRNTSWRGHWGDWMDAQRWSSRRFCGRASRDLLKKLPGHICGGSFMPGVKGMGSNVLTPLGCMMLAESSASLSLLIVCRSGSWESSLSVLPESEWDNPGDELWVGPWVSLPYPSPSSLCSPKKMAN